MPNCFIDNTYMDECIIDPRDGKLRHCSECEAVIQELRDDYEALDNKKRRYGEGPFVDGDFDLSFLDGDYTVIDDLLEEITVDHEDYEE